MSLNLEQFAGMKRMLATIPNDAAAETEEWPRTAGGSLTQGAAGWNPKIYPGTSGHIRRFPAIKKFMLPPKGKFGRLTNAVREPINRW